MNKRQKEDDSEIKPNFALSGLLAADKRTGNLQRATTTSSAKPTVVVSKYSPPSDGMKPEGGWRLFAFPPSSPDVADGDNIKTLYLHGKQHFVFGQLDELVDFVVEGGGEIAEEHAVLQYRKEPGKIYLMDLNSESGTKLNGEKVMPTMYIQLLDGDVIQFGHSEWEFELKQPK
ncbi:hypothetical protein BASA81_001925 [Batrachochytrium salamandrivorans]|nr:hypothetical protein BASA81_001925 [Batrachochytrium salamandrivorans]